MKMEIIGKSKEWKDQAAGYHHWKVWLDRPCLGCGKEGKYYTIWGTKSQVENFANNPENNYCNKCS